LPGSRCADADGNRTEERGARSGEQGAGSKEQEKIRLKQKKD